MNKLFLIPALGLLAVTPMVLGLGASSPPGKAPLAGETGREVSCSQPVDMQTDKISSEVNSYYDYVSEVANDCQVEVPGTLTRVSWWGGYIDGPPGDPEVTTFILRFYEDSDLSCTPGVVIAELLDQAPSITYIGDGPSGYPTYIYDLAISVHLEPGIFWFGVQAVNEAMRFRYPPKHGRAGDGGDKAPERSCETMFRSAYYGFPDWTPISEVIGHPWTASQEFEFIPDQISTRQDTWGAMKSLYR